MLPRLKSLGSALFLVAALAVHAGPAQDAYAAKLSGDYPRAIELYRQLLTQEPGNSGYCFQLGTVLGWAGRYDEALDVLGRGVEQAPGNTDLRLARARVLAWSGDLPRAEDEIRTILGTQPANLEARNMLGRVLMWRRQFDAADEVFQGILALQPDNTDALIGAGDVQKLQERYDQARPYYEHALRLDPGSADVQRRVDSVRQAGRWRLDAGAEVSSYTGNSTQSNWQGWDANLRYALDRKTGLSLGTAWAHRYGLNDQQYSAGIDHRFTDDLSGYGRATVTPSADFFARHSLAVGGQWRFRDGTVSLPATLLLADYRVSAYDPGTAHSIALGLTQYLNRNVALTGKYLLSRNLNGHWTNGWQVILEGDPNDYWHWKVGYADSSESLSATVVDYVRDLRNLAVFAGAYHEFTPAFGLRLDVAHEWNPGAPARNTLHVGFVTRF